MQYKFSYYPKVFVLISFLGVYIDISKQNHSVCFFNAILKLNKYCKQSFKELQ